ncbi:unnamed protein product [Paramecium sonneborni]|uniref:EF-hand domain-containing protein n=1 Tax=Paramecium sonneborni TaxID=65129 RepID=A0A8S1NR91_9CILI|nr:unnamed protein product [Paramecium sonneborni]
MKKMMNIEKIQQSKNLNLKNKEQTLKNLCIIWQQFHLFRFEQDIFLQKEISIYPLDKELFKLIFNLFDENKSELLDFREFLICLSILIRGSFDEKFKMIFLANTSKILQFNDFEALLLILIAQYIQITKEYQQFIERIKRPSFTYFDMLNVLKDPFIIQIELLKKQKKSGIKKCAKQNRIINE